MRRIVGITAAVAVTIGLAAVPAATAASASPQPVEITRFLGEQRLPYKMPYAGTTVGGLSGLDRDPLTGTWYLISDDRGRYGPARFYTGRFAFDRTTGAFTGVHLTGVDSFLRPDGSTYPPYGEPGSADPETIRYDPWTGRLLWGDEGDRPDEGHPDIPPSGLYVHRADAQGRQVGELPMPANMRMTTTDSGPRRNFGIEGLALTPRTITTVTEGPRFEDGEPPTVEHGAAARLTVWSRFGSKPSAQYVYPIDPLPTAPVPPTGHSDSGVSEILAIDEHRFLALERSWLEGVGYRVKLYEIDLRGATNVLARNSLTTGGSYRPVTKRLVTDLDEVRTPVQNLESLAWGPRLRTGECTLVIGSDDNFAAEEATQFLAFATRSC
ncbi:esterase-like activity of phytase family protein [Nonomuraea sp. NPDC050680]|uniref:esterase-like activity of phytase family protein n=1 Tax=Nonomuraea sp. NPDC050680 TaxID=3154630 RepID=UPI0033EEAF54